MYALVDCNNFYASCERLFNPALEKKPIIVLSNNDGCVVARSEEAKRIGIVMGVPAYSIVDLVKKNGVRVFSSNYTLYGDLSDRVMQTLGSFVPKLEIYSIDEAFLDMAGLPPEQLPQLGKQIKYRVKKNIGIPVSVGIGPTKTLAKMANHFAKKSPRADGVFCASGENAVREMLLGTNIADIWGIGREYTLFLQKHGFHTAFDFSRAPEEWVRKNLSVVGQRLLNELRGTPCLLNLVTSRPKKNICVSRSFGKLLEDKDAIRVAITNYAALCAAKLRQQQSCCKKLHVFIKTNPHQVAHRQYFMSITIDLDIASSNTADIIKYAMKAFDIIFKPGFKYMKCGVMVMDFVPEAAIQSNLFASARGKEKKMMAAMDELNKCFGSEILRTASQGFEPRYKRNASFLSPCYTTNIKEILTVKI